MPNPDYCNEGDHRCGGFEITQLGPRPCRKNMIKHHTCSFYSPRRLQASDSYFKKPPFKMRASRLVIFGLATSSTILASPVDPFPYNLEEMASTHASTTISTTVSWTSVTSVIATERPPGATPDPDVCGVGFSISPFVLTAKRMTKLSLRSLSASTACGKNLVCTGSPGLASA